jgi:MFS family permease
MYSEDEIESAVASGKLSREAADALRAHAEEVRTTPNADEEQIRLVTSFNDIFVSIAAVLVLVAAGWIGMSIGRMLTGGIAVAAAAWGLAEFFTRRRHMALPSIILLFAFLWGVNAAVSSFFVTYGAGGLLAGVNLFTPAANPDLMRHVMINGAVVYAAVLAAAWFHWQRFAVPITVAACVANVAGLLATLVFAIFPHAGQWMLVFVFLLGLAVFAFAMWWDMQDRNRTTRKSDVAFWLHLLASPMIIHPVFWMLGINFAVLGGQASDGNITLLAIIAIVMYVMFGFIALVIDRRAFLVSALVYVLIAIIFLFGRVGIKGVGFAVAALVIGSGLLMLSAFWQGLRARLLPMLPLDWQQRLPAIGRIG